MNIILWSVAMTLGLLVGTHSSGARAQTADDTVLGFSPSGKLSEVRSELQRWDQSVLGFRKEHQFSLTSGPVSGQWHFKRFGTVRNKTYESSGIYSKFQYSFHIPIYRSFGYYLGTSFGYINEDDKTEGLDAASAFMLPGVLVGFSYNFSPGFRLVTGLDYYLERWHNLGERDGEGENPTITATARAIDGLVAVDLFYRLKWAVRFEGHRRESTLDRPRKARDKPLDAQIVKNDSWLGMGLLYHLM